MPVEQEPEVKDKPKLPSPKDRHKVILQTEELSDGPAEVKPAENEGQFASNKPADASKKGTQADGTGIAHKFEDNGHKFEEAKPTLSEASLKGTGNNADGKKGEQLEAANIPPEQARMDEQSEAANIPPNKEATIETTSADSPLNHEPTVLPQTGKDDSQPGNGANQQGTTTPETIISQPTTQSKLSEDDFEDVTVEDLDLDPPSDKKPVSPATASSRPGVTESVPPSASILEAATRRSTIAEDLAAAEAKAESDALSASQGPTSLKGKDVPALEIPQDQAAFEEETLQSAEQESQAVRPMSPPFAAPVAPLEASISAPNEPDEYVGLVYYDGVDGLGRPVVVINADVLPRSASRKAAVDYLLQRLEPIVTQGPYVCVFLSTGEKSNKNRLQAGWLASCYRQMSYPFKKNVKYVILVRPSLTLKLMLTLMRPLISRKALPKIKKVETLSAIESMTNGEVKLQHLGLRFNTIAAKSIVAGEGPGFGQGSAYQMPTL